MKAIHNGKPLINSLILTVFNTSKIQNESNSQPTQFNKKTNTYCVQYVKDTK